MPTTKEIYDSSIRPLPPKERLNLAALILSDLTHPDAPEIDFSYDWSEEDMRDLTKYSLSVAAQRHPEDDDLV
jgi:hypothetical protein